MRMILAPEAVMAKLLHLILAFPEHFSRSEVPCCLQGIWEAQLGLSPSDPVAPVSIEAQQLGVSPSATVLLSAV